ncbi:MAG: class I SAM-dependent methyltransferase [Haliea sp.]
MPEEKHAAAFDTCEICSSSDWEEVYTGPIRAGSFGKTIDAGLIGGCLGCGVKRLAEAFCPTTSFYETAEYRSFLDQQLDSESYFAAHDELQHFTLEAFWPRSLRNKTVLDVGCGAGSFLDHIRSIAGRVVAIEPCTAYHRDLRGRGIDVWSYASEFAQGFGKGQIDYAFALQVIEHVADPCEFLKEIRPLMRDDGLLIISTPNSDDILMHLLPDDFPKFFFRAVHRWYFDMTSLSHCAELAGFEIVAKQHVHRYGLSNTLQWLRDRVPSGHQRLQSITPLADDFWKAYLEAAGQSDNLYIFLSPSSNGPAKGSSGSVGRVTAQPVLD